METTKTQSFYEQVDAAVEAGDRQLLTQLYEEKFTGFTSYINLSGYSAQVLEAELNAARKDPKRMQRDLLTSIMATQSMLLHRAQAQILSYIHEDDRRHNGARPWGQLSPEITDELLPRFGKISDEIRVTIRLMNSLEAPRIAVPSEATLAG